MPNLPFLTHTLPLYEQHLASWHREERRLYGGDAVLEELLQWKGETDDDLAARKLTAGYMPLPKSHATTLTGHLSSQTPDPDFGNLGKANERPSLENPSLAEILKFNVDGPGQDGSELRPYFDGVQERAIATGYRWVLAEKPGAATLRNIRLSHGRDPEGKLLKEDIIQGFRPYAVEYSPISVPFWQPLTGGPLDLAIIRMPITPESLIDEEGSFMSAGDLGYYLLVRRGFTGLGNDWAEGGWWKFDPDQDLVPDGHGTWDETLGQIPLLKFIGEGSPGTTARPAIARSLTMELGQIAVSLMTLRSARDYNVLQAAKSVNHILGIKPTEHGQVIVQQDAGSISIGYPPVMGDDGAVIVPTIWNSSEGLVASEAFESVIKSGLEEAREIMVKQVTSGLDASGEKVKASFAEGTSPLLSRLAGTRQQAMNTFLYFASLRFGIQNPTANVTIPRDFNLQSVVDDIDEGLSVLKRSWLRSPTLEKNLIIRSMDERGLMPEDKTERAKIEQELTDSATPTEPVDLTLDDLSTVPGLPGGVGVPGTVAFVCRSPVTDALTVG